MSFHPTMMLTLLVLAMTFANPAFAQMGNAAGMAPGTDEAMHGVPAPHQPNQPDQIFVRAASIAGMGEVDFGKLALQDAQSDVVKEFARRMVNDHEKANRELAALGAADHIPIPTKLDLEHVSLRVGLEKLKGSDFDHAYIQGQLVDHQRAALLLAYEIGAGQDADFIAFASRTLPVVLEHLQMAQDAATKLWGVAPQGANATISMRNTTP